MLGRFLRCALQSRPASVIRVTPAAALGSHREQTQAGSQGESELAVKEDKRRPYQGDHTHSVVGKEGVWLSSCEGTSFLGRSRNLCGAESHRSGLTGLVKGLDFILGNSS